MATVLKGTFTIKQVINYTYQYYKNRFENKKRDVLKRITIRRIKRYDPDRINAPIILYEITTYSYPNYKPYFDPKSGRKYQRKIKHEYDIILQLAELSLNTTAWRIKVGSGKKWQDKPSQRLIKQVYRETREKWKKKSLKKGKTKKEQAEWLKKKILDHKESAKYESVGDYNARVNGIMADFYFRLAYVFKKYDHLYGYMYSSNKPAKEKNPNEVPFFTKHTLRILEILMNKGILV